MGKTNCPKREPLLFHHNAGGFLAFSILTASLSTDNCASEKCLPLPVCCTLVGCSVFCTSPRLPALPVGPLSQVPGTLACSLDRCCPSNGPLNAGFALRSCPHAGQLASVVCRTKVVASGCIGTCRQTPPYRPKGRPTMIRVSCMLMLLAINALIGYCHPRS